MVYFCSSIFFISSPSIGQKRDGGGWGCKKIESQNKRELLSCETSQHWLANFFGCLRIFVMSNKSYAPFEVKVNEIQKDSNVKNSLPIQGKKTFHMLCLSMLEVCVQLPLLGVCLVCILVCVLMCVLLCVLVCRRSLSECPTSPGSPRLRIASSTNQTIGHSPPVIKFRTSKNHITQG